MAKPTNGCSRGDAIYAAIRRLASLYEYGALQADTDPAAFINRVADDVTALRASSPADRSGEGRTAATLTALADRLWGATGPMDEQERLSVLSEIGRELRALAAPASLREPEAPPAPLATPPGVDARSPREIGRDLAELIASHVAEAGAHWAIGEVKVYDEAGVCHGYLPDAARRALDLIDQKGGAQ